MAARSIGSVTLLLGLVAIPAKLFTATSMKSVSFNRLHKQPCGSRIKQQLICEAESTPDKPKVLQNDELVSGFEYTPDKYVTFTAEELKQLELQADPGRIRIVEVVPLATVDPKFLAKTIYLGPDKGAATAYGLIAAELAERGYVAIGQLGSRTRDDLVLVRPHKGGLVLHECFYADEVRSFEETEAVTGTFTATRKERDLAGQLLDAMFRPAFSPERFVNGGADRVAAAVALKVAGKEIVVPPPRAGVEPLDLEEALSASLREVESQRPKGPKKAGKASAPASRLQATRRRRATA